MKSFLDFIKEELTDKQKVQVSKWVPKNREKFISFSDHVFANSVNHRVSTPLIPDDPVKDHLEQHGFSVDRDKNVAVDKHGREQKIGKALSKTGAPEDLLLRHNRDAARKVNYKADESRKIIISRQPEDIAGMSTGRSWESCMSMDSGSNRHHLKHDIKHGTHVAYLVHKDDNNIKYPLARIALKPYQSEDGKHTILRPEERSYGSSSDQFSVSVRKWTEDNFPTKPKTIYTKHKDLYNDSMNSYTHSNDTDTINHFANHGDTLPHHNAVFNSDNANAKVSLMSRLLNSKEKNSSSIGLGFTSQKNHIYSEHTIEKAASLKDRSITEHVARYVNEHLDREHPIFKKLISGDNWGIKRSFTEGGNKENLEHILHNSDWSKTPTNFEDKYDKSKVISDILSHPDVAKQAISHPGFMHPDNIKNHSIEHSDHLVNSISHAVTSSSETNINDHNHVINTIDKIFNHPHVDIDTKIKIGSNLALSVGMNTPHLVDNNTKTHRLKQITNHTDNAFYNIIKQNSNSKENKDTYGTKKSYRDIEDTNMKNSHHDRIISGIQNPHVLMSMAHDENIHLRDRRVAGSRLNSLSYNQRSKTSKNKNAFNILHGNEDTWNDLHPKILSTLDHLNKLASVKEN